MGANGEGGGGQNARGIVNKINEVLLMLRKFIKPKECTRLDSVISILNCLVFS